MRHHFFVSTFLSACLFATSTIAQQNTLDPVVVTATRTPQSVSNTLAPLVLITRKDIEKSQANSLQQLLSGLPGIDITSIGGLGSNSSIYTRGTKTAHTLFMVDGVRIGSATLGETAFQDIPLHLVERIEILRGPRSSLYGSRAMGGVIQIFTRKAKEDTEANVFVGTGTHNTSELSAGVTGSTGKAKFNIQGSLTKTDGINDLSTSNPDKDGYENQSFTASFTDAVSDLLEIGFNIYYVESDKEYDGTPFFNPTVLTDINTSENISTTTSTDIKLFLADNWDSTIQLATNRDESNNFLNGAENGVFETSQNQIIWQNDIQLTDNHLFTIGYDHLDEDVDSSNPISVNTRYNKAAYAQIQSSYTKQDITLATRHDNNESFKSHTTGNIDWRYRFNKHYSITASYGTAFKAPTFNDLYWPTTIFSSGNPNLKPEKSKSSEIIIRNKQQNMSWELNLYKTKIKDLIEWQEVSPGFWTPSNVDKANIEGIEASINTILDDWNVLFVVGAIDPRNEVTDKKLIRRSSKSTKLALDKDFGKYTVGISTTAYGERFEDINNTVKLSGYGITNIRTSYKLAKDITLQAKVDNLFDKDFETAKDYNSLDRTIFVSLRYLIN